LSVHVHPTKHKRGWVHPSYSFIQPNVRWDELIPDIRDDPVPSLLNPQINTC
jgi:hypothetical protein